MRISLRLFRLGPVSAYTTLWRSRGKYWTHPGCPVHHRRKDTANRCPNRAA